MLRRRRWRACFPACAGRLMQSELEALEKALGKPERPVVAVVGGAKVSTKLELLGNLIDKVDTLVIGGGMANTFLAAQGIEVGKSLCEHDLAETAREIMRKAEAGKCIILLPTDVVIAREFKPGAAYEIVPADACPPDAMILDAGPATVARIVAIFADARTLVWNGPLGAFEVPPFNAATDAAARQAATLTRAGTLLSVAGGGDTVAALNASGSAEAFTYVSTAGGAFLEWLEGKTPPGRRRARRNLTSTPAIRGTTMKATRTVQKILSYYESDNPRREGQPLPHADAGPARRNRQDDHPAGRSGLRARPGAKLRAQPRRLRSALPFPARNRRRAERLRRAARHDRGGGRCLRRPAADDPEGQFGQLADPGGRREGSGDHCARSTMHSGSAARRSASPSIPGRAAAWRCSRKSPRCARRPPEKAWPR